MSGPRDKSRGAARPGAKSSRKPGAKPGLSAGRRGSKGHGHRGPQDQAPQADLIERALTEVLKLEAPADAVLRAFFRAHPQMGRRDRGRLAETVFDVLRHRRRYDHLAAAGSGPHVRRLRWLSRCLAFGDPLPADGALAEWVTAARRIDASTLPPAVRYSMPDWLWEALAARYPWPEVGRIAESLLEPAPLDLRVNTLKATVAQVDAALAQADLGLHPLPWPPGALRLDGKPALEELGAFVQGWFEVQDAGSQLLAHVVAPRRGQTVVDFCAGAGGKTLALAAMLAGTGQVFAVDVSTSRLIRMRPRLARSGATNVQPMAIDDEHDPKLKRLAGRADRVLVDAPCTGTGTLRRNPDLKWRQTPADVAELGRRQTSILAAAARLVKPGGRLVYATCSLLDTENGAVADAFEAAHPEFTRVSVGELLAAQRTGPAGVGDRLELRPDLHGCDGFFAAAFERVRG